MSGGSEAGDALPIPVDLAYQSHRRALLSRGRCPECAELIRGTRALFAQEPCGHCGYERADENATGAPPLPPWRRRRWGLYAAVAVVSSVVSWLPLVGTLIVVAAMVAARWYVLGESLRWLSPARRVCTRFAVRLGIGFLAALALVVQEALTLLPFVGWLTKPVAGLAVIILFIEVGGRYVEGRVRRDAEGPALDTWEWLVPASMFGATMSVVVAGVLLLNWVWERAATLLEWLPV